MTRLGPGRTRATIAWLSGAIMACALIGTCLALLRSDILPFRDAWPNAQGSRTGVSQLAAPQAASRPVGRPSFAAQPTTIGGAPAIGFPGLPTATGPLSVAGSGPLAGTPGSGSTTRTQTTGTGRLGQPTTELPTFPAPTPTVSAPAPTSPATAASSTPDVAGAIPDVPVQVSAANRTGPAGRSTDADATRADDDPPAETVPPTVDTPARPVDGDVPAGPPVGATPTTPATETPAPSAPGDSEPPTETAPVSTTPPADATSQPADPGPEQTPPAPESTPTPDPSPAPPAPADSAPQSDPSPAPPADAAPQADAPAAPATPAG